MDDHASFASTTLAPTLGDSAGRAPSPAAAPGAPGWPSVRAPARGPLACARRSSSDQSPFAIEIYAGHIEHSFHDLSRSPLVHSGIRVIDHAAQITGHSARHRVPVDGNRSPYDHIK